MNPQATVMYPSVSYGLQKRRQQVLLYLHPSTSIPPPLPAPNPNRHSLLARAKDRISCQIDNLKLFTELLGSLAKCIARSKLNVRYPSPHSLGGPEHSRRVVTKDCVTSVLIVSSRNRIVLVILSAEIR